jgi:hypothetical protein
MSISEDLSNCDVDFPLKESFKQPTIACEDDDGEEWWFTDVWVTAEPGEFETSTDKKILSNFAPRPKKVARLKQDIAKKSGLTNPWTFMGKADAVEMPDGSKKTFPKGSVTLQVEYVPDFPWPEYKWPEGSL